MAAWTISVSVDSCMYPLNIPHATVIKVGLESAEYSLSSQVAYTCHPDYQLEGDTVFTCLTDGCWYPNMLPVCHPRRSSTHYDSEYQHIHYLQVTQKPKCRIYFHFEPMNRKTLLVKCAISYLDAISHLVFAHKKNK